MRISELSRRAGTPVGTIKFYLREKLLPPGRPTGRNQADYGEAHVRRLQLIRAFTHVAGLDLSSVRSLLSAIEDEALAPAGLYQAVDRAVEPGMSALDEDGEVRAARSDVGALAERMRWDIDPDASSRTELIHVFAALKRLGCTCETDFFLPYAQAADDLVQRELDLVPPACSGADRAAAVVRGILLEVAMTALRRMAMEHRVAERFGQLPAPPDTS